MAPEGAGALCISTHTLEILFSSHLTSNCRKRSWSSSRSASRSPGRSGARVRPPSSLDGVSAHLPVYQGMIAAAAGMLNATNPVLFGLPGFAQGGLGSSTVVQPEPTVDQTQVELFVGNTPPGISEIALLTFLNAAMNQAGLSASPGMPIVQCRVSNKFAFIRLRSVEETTKALSLNGIPLTGTYLMVKRPAKYTGPSVQAPTWQEVTGQGGNVVTDPGVSLPDKVLRELYVGNVNANMSEDSIKDFIGATMQQVGLNAKPGNPVLAVRNNGSFAFVEFRSVEEASNALNLDGIPLHGCNLRFSRPSKYEGPNEPHGTWELTLRAHLAKRSVPTRVLRIGNIVSEEDLKSESALQELEDETKEECEKLSQVTSVFLPRPNAATEEERAGVGYMWVCFESADGASAAMACLCLRTFEGRAIQAVFWDEEKYEKRDFRPDEEAGKEQVGSS